MLCSLAGEQTALVSWEAFAAIEAPVYDLLDSTTSLLSYASTGYDRRRLDLSLFGAAWGSYASRDYIQEEPCV